MKKCPFCAEEVQDEAIKCKHCFSDLGQAQPPSIPEAVSKTEPVLEKPVSPIEPAIQKDNSVGKIIGAICVGIVFLLIAFGGSAWYLIFATAITWLFVKKTKFEKNVKVGFGLIVFLMAFVAVANGQSKLAPPVLAVTEPQSNFSVQATTTTIVGTVEPPESLVQINGNVVEVVDGNFSYLADLVYESNQFDVVATNPQKSTAQVTQSIVVTRIYSEEELTLKKQREEEIVAARQAEAAEKEAAAEAVEAEWLASKPGKICSTHPTWTKEDCTRLADGKIWIGMHIDMVKYHYGAPDSANPSNYGYGTQWQWCWFGATPSCFYDDNDDGYVDSYN